MERSSWSRMEYANIEPTLSLRLLLRGNRTGVQGRWADSETHTPEPVRPGFRSGLPTVPHHTTLSKHPDTLHPLLLLYLSTHGLGCSGEGSAHESSVQRETLMGLSAARLSPTASRSCRFTHSIAPPHLCDSFPQWPGLSPSILGTLTLRDPATPARQLPSCSTKSWETLAHLHPRP